MIIPINTQYRIVSDEYQWIIQRIRTRKGKEDWQARLYYPDLKAAVAQALTPKIEVKTGTDP